MKKSAAITLVLITGISTGCDSGPELMDDCPPNDVANCSSNRDACMAAGGNCTVGGGYYIGSSYVPYYGGHASFYAGSSGLTTTGARPNGVVSSVSRGGFGFSAHSSGS